MRETIKKMENNILKYFDFSGLPENQVNFAKMIYYFAEDIDFVLPDSEEKKQGFRKLLEAKDCFFRANFQ
jgi:hypothetical protein